MERGKRDMTSQRGGSLLQKQRSRWERLKNYFAFKFWSEIILPAVVYDRCPSPETVHRTVSEFTPCRAHAVCFLWGAAPRPASLLKKA